MGIFSAKPTNLTQSTTTTLGAQGNELFSSIFPKIQQYAQSTPQMFAGSGIAGFTPAELQAQEQYKNQTAGTVGDLAAQSANAQSMLLDPNFMLGDNQHLQNMRSAITGSVTDDFLQRVLPGVRSGNIAASGMYSGGASKAGQAEGLATAQTGTGLSRQLSELMFNAYNTGLGRMQGAVAGTGAVQGQQLMAPDILAGVGAQERAMEQARLDEEIMKFYAGQSLPFLQAQELLAVLQGLPGATTTSKVTGHQGGASPLTQILGMGAAGLGSAAKFK